MSKLGKKPIIIPKDTKIKLESGRLILTGPKGSKELSINDKIFSATIADDKNLVLIKWLYYLYQYNQIYQHRYYLLD